MLPVWNARGGGVTQSSPHVQSEVLNLFVAGVSASESHLLFQFTFVNQFLTLSRLPYAALESAPPSAPIPIIYVNAEAA